MMPRTRAIKAVATTPQEISAYRDSEEGRLLPNMKAAGIKPEGGG
jgi:hypothetical protein